MINITIRTTIVTNVQLDDNRTYTNSVEYAQDTVSDITVTGTHSTYPPVLSEIFD